VRPLGAASARKLLVVGAVTAPVFPLPPILFLSHKSFIGSQRQMVPAAGDAIEGRHARSNLAVHTLEADLRG
jgi:hypothetical protein